MKLRYSLLVILLIFAIGWNFYDFNEEKDIKYEHIPKLCEKLGVKKNLINPIYMS